MRSQTRFRPCIDLHEGQVKQIVGGTLDSKDSELQTNHVSERPAEWFAELYAKDQLTGGHVIQLGPGNESAARKALSAYPGGLQLGGGIRPDNAISWIEAGASHVIATSCLFDASGRFQEDQLEKLAAAVGPERLVIDLSCRRVENGWVVAMNRWQTLTDLPISPETLTSLAPHCAEFLIHAADVEGKCQGIDEELVRFLGSWGQIPLTYAGGASSFEDLERVSELSQGKVDLTIGSALDIFGGTRVSYEQCVAYNHR